MTALMTHNFNEMRSQVDNSTGQWQDLPIAAMFLSTGGPLTTGSDPRKAIVTNDLPDLGYWAAGNASAGVVAFRVPADYVVGQDDAKFRFTASMAGASDTPAMACAGSVKKVRSRTSGAMGTLASSSAITGTAPTEYEIDLSGQSLQPGDVVTLTLTPGTHATDILYLWGAAFRYRGCLRPAIDDQR